MNTSLFEISQAQLREMFGLTPFQRGIDYQKMGRVNIISSTENSSKLTLRADVKGTQRKPYQTQISLEQNEFEIWSESRCSCPVGANCKHCVAAILVYFNQAKTQLQAETAQVQKWLKALQKNGLSESSKSVSAPSDSGQQIKYLLFSKNQTLLVQMVKAQRLKSGNFGQRISKLDLWRLRSVHSQTALSEQDKNILLLLLALRSQVGYSTYYNHVSECVELKGELGKLCLEKILATGHCHWQDHQKDALRWEQPRDLEMAWQKERGGQRLQLSAAGHPCHIFFEPSQIYLDLKYSALGDLESHLNHKQLGILLDAPLIPEAILEDVSRQFIKSLPEAPLPADIVSNIQDLPITEPIPHLTLRTQIQRRKHAEPHYLAELSFAYEQHFLAGPLEPVSLLQTETGHLRIRRQLHQEKEALQRLSAFGLADMASTQKKTGLYQFHFAKDSPAETLAAWDQFLNTELPQLQAAGWQVTQKTDFLAIDNPAQWQAQIQANQDRDWIEFGLDFEVHGQRVNLLPLLVQLLKQYEQPESLLLSLAQQENLLLPLGNHRWARVPAERVLSILKALIELYDREPLNDQGQLELSWAQSLALEELLNAPDLKWFGAERLQTLIDKLKEFKGIEKIPVPSGLKTQLRPYQAEGLNWLHFLYEYGFCGILADDMGLGKTIQALAFLLHLKEQDQLKRPVLIVAPTSLLFNWQREAARFAPDLKVLVIHGPQRHELFDQIPETDLVITTYTLARLDQKAHSKTAFAAIILDEAQNIKNAKTQTAMALFKYKSAHRLCLTGTPLENHLGELWSIYHFLMPGFLGPLERFSRFFRTPIEKQANPERREQLRKRVEPFLLRRTKQAVLLDLPEKTEIISFISLEEEQRNLYESVRIAMDSRIREEIGSKGLKRSQIMLLDALLKLRQTCCDPRLVKLESAQGIQTSAKLEALLEALDTLLEEGRSIIVFSQFVEMLKLIGQALEKKGLDYALLTGQTRKREEAVDRFQTGEVKLFLISLKAGGVGLNLTAADTVIHYDPWWNPAVENQATDRAWRIGQDKKVFVYKLIAEKTVEEKILALQEKKRTLINSIYSENSEGSHAVSPEELLALLEITP